MPTIPVATVDADLERALLDLTRGGGRMVPGRRGVAGRRAVLGIAGAPGAGKTTLSEKLVDLALHHGVRAVALPMDGFHLADVQLDRLGSRDRKGAIDTFDGDGYLAALDRVRHADRTVYVPAFDRTIEQPVAGSIAIDPDVELVVTEGNYLLADVEPWTGVRDRLDAAWFCRVDDGIRTERLVARHVAFGKTPDAAARWVATVDDPNARRIAGTADRADRVVVLDGDRWH